MQISKHRKILLPTRMLKLARMTPNVGEDGEQMEQVYTTGRAIESYNQLGQLTVFTKDKNMLTLWPSSSTPRYTPKRNEGTMFPKRGEVAR